MWRKIIQALFYGMLTIGSANAQTYDALWKQVEAAAQKDVPRTQISALENIERKARKENAYGQLLKARLKRAGLEIELSPDSIEPIAAQLQQEMALAERSDGALAAVMNTVMGTFYANRTDLEDNAGRDSATVYFRRSLSDLPLLARTKASGFRPMVEEGKDSRWFNDDLLSVIGFQAADEGFDEALSLMHHYYDNAGNRKAALYLACRMNEDADSLIRRYGDMQECGLAAEQKLSSMYNQPATHRVAFAEEALRRWPNYYNANVFKNEIARQKQPEYEATLSHTMNTPGRENLVRLERLRNIGCLRMRVIDKQTKATVADVEHPYRGYHAYDVHEDSMSIPSLPLGNYMVEFSTDRADIEKDTVDYYVSNLTVINQGLPNRRKRFFVLDATTGHPVPGAKIAFYRWHSNKEHETVVTTNEQGVFEEQGNDNYSSYRAYTDTDHYMPRYHGGRSSYGYHKTTGTSERLNIYTDRAVYRPGQTLHASVLAFTNKGGESVSLTTNRQICLRLFDANGKQVSEQRIVTDEYGAASADFVLPEGKLTGRYSLRTDYGRAYRAFRVEEYKRPTFEVTFEKVTTAYRLGDTITVKGTAKTFAGVPVQGAKVSYRTTRGERFCWWMRHHSGEETLSEGEVVTDDEGRFEVVVPLVAAENTVEDRPTWNRTRFYRFTVEADVTDQGGETQSGETVLPLGTRPTILYADLPQKILKDSLQQITFTRENAAGEHIDGIVTYSIDGGRMYTAKANTSLSLRNAKHGFAGLTSGQHVLKAVCGEDTLEQQFVIFTLNDARPPVETPDWFYQSSNKFGDKPVSIIVGSSDENVQVFYSVFSGNAELEHGSFLLSNSNRRMDYSYLEKYGDGLLLTFAWVKDGETYVHEAKIERPLPDKRLLTKWITFRDRLTPGQEETWTLQITHPDGKTAKSQLLAVLFDKSLDLITPHGWSLDLGLKRCLPYSRWMGTVFGQISAAGAAPQNILKEYAPVFSHFSEAIRFARYNRYVITRGVGRLPMMRTMRTVSMASVDMAAADGMTIEEPMAMSANAKMVAANEAVSMVETEETAAGFGASVSSTQGTKTSPQLRENLQETAFFYPALETDSKGNVSLRFKLPESVTTWRFIGLAHDKSLNYGFTETEAVAQKNVMVMPNVPRFVREGDEATIAARITCMTDHGVSGTARMQLLNPETETVVSEQSMPFSVKANGTTAVHFKINTDELKSESSELQSLYICRIYAEGDGFSDGEQHYLPLLPNRELVTNILPFTQNEAGELRIPLSKLFGNAVPTNDARVTVEYTDNPAWLMMQALPYVSNARNDDAISLAASYYANSLGKNILSQNPRMKQVFEQWQKEKGKKTSLTSALEKNQELKSLVIDETPWVNDAQNEGESKRKLANFFNENALNYQLERSIKGLNRLQNDDGSFSWWRGMNGSTVMTAEVMELLTRLNLLLKEDDKSTRTMLDKAHRFLSAVVVREVKTFKQREREKKPVYIHDWHALQWMYLCALENRTLTKDEQMAKDYLMNYLKKQKLSQNLYAKALMTVVLLKDGQTDEAKEYAQSLLEYTVYKDEMGRYYDTPRAGYSWLDYRIPTQTVVIEALQMMKSLPEGYGNAVEEMQRWLLQEKRTQAWDTPINSVNAVFAFLNGRTNVLEPQTPTVLKLDGKAIETSEATAGLGYTKTVLPEGRATSSSVFTAERASDVPGWGALYAQFLQPTSEVENRTEGLKVEREVLSDVSNLKVGDKIKVRLIIRAERDYDFVQLVDKRAACLEPVSQLSGYHWGYYIAPKDNATCYYFDRLSKGKHVIETEYYVDRAGRYQSGTCTVQCAYAPEYMARAKAVTLNVKE